MHLDEKEIHSTRKKITRPPVRRVLKSEQIPPKQNSIKNSEPTKTPTAHPRFAMIINAILTWTVCGMVFLMPLFILPFLSEPIELAKQSLLFVGTFVVALCYILTIVITNKVTLRVGTWMIGALALLASWLIATIFSIFPYGSFFGLDGQQVMSFSSLASFVLLAFIISQTFTTTHIARCLNAFFFSTIVVSILGMLQLFGVFILPWDFAKNTGFSLVGRFDLWGVLVALSIVLALLQLIRRSASSLPRTKTSLFLVAYIGIMLIPLIMLNDRGIWTSIIAGLAVALTILYLKLPHDKKIDWVILPCFVIIFSGVMIISHPRTVTLPLLVQPTWGLSTHIATKTLFASPLAGYGQGNFLTNFTRFRPINSNADNFLGFWTLRFDQSNSYFLTAIAATGLLGLLGLLAFLFFFLRSFFDRIFRDTLSDDRFMLLTVGAGVITLLVASLLKPSNMAVSFLLWVCIGFCGTMLARTVRILEIRTSRFLILSSLGLYVLISLGLIGLAVTGNRLSASIAYASGQHMDRELSGLQQTSQQQPDPKKVDELIMNFARASAQEPRNPLYARTLSTALSYRLNELGASKNQKDGSSAQDTDAQIQDATALMIQSARNAYNSNPHDIRNVENLATTYQEIVPYADGADSFVVDFLDKAMELDPSNPAHQLAKGQFLLAMSLIHSQRAESMKTEQADAKSAEEKSSSDALTGADTALKKALELKSDYAPALYTLGLLRAQQKNKEEAIKYLDSAMIANVDLFTLQNADEGLFLSLGSSYLGLGERDKAELALKNALSVNPNSEVAQWQLALLYADEGKKQDALSILEDLQKKNPGNDTITKKISELQGGATPSDQVPTPPETK